MPWVIAIMVALTVIAAARRAGAAQPAQPAAAADLSGGMTVQIVEADRRDRASARRGGAAARLRETPGVTAVRRGAAGGGRAADRAVAGRDGWQASDAIPGAGADRCPAARVQSMGRCSARSRRSVREVAPAARVDAQSSWLRPVFEAIDSLQWLALALVGGAGARDGGSSAAGGAHGAGCQSRDDRDRPPAGRDRRADRADVPALRSGSMRLAAGDRVGAWALVVMLFLGRQFADLGAGLVDAARLGWVRLDHAGA